MVEKVKKIMDMLPEMDRMTIIKIYQDWEKSEPEEVPKKVEKLLKLFAMLDPDEQKIFHKNIMSNEKDSSDEYMWGDKWEKKEGCPMEEKKEEKAEWPMF